MSFDDDAAGDSAGFRPPPHPDDRLWRHPSEVVGARQVGLAPQPRHTWPWGLVAVVGTAGVLLAGAGALFLGFRGEVGGDQFVQAVDTTLPATPNAMPDTWLGIEGLSRDPADDANQLEELDDSLPAGSAALPTTTSSDDGSTDSSETTGEPAATATTLPPTSTPQGVTVAEVDPDGPAADALQPGDVLLEVDGQPIVDMNALLDRLLAYQPGDQVEVTYLTLDDAGRESLTTALVTLAARPTDISAVPADEW